MSANTDPVETDAGWPDAWVAALSNADLVEASSATVVACGAGYFGSGAVDVDAEDPLPEPALRARVTGTAESSVAFQSAVFRLLPRRRLRRSERLPTTAVLLEEPEDPTVAAGGVRF